jgi:MoaA/NifB/PqqE/SkfB family radical SAM enzyme
VTLIGQLTSTQKPLAVHINGHGETTFMSGWVEICRKLLAYRLPLVVTTNLAKNFTADEMDVMARLHTIMVSIDTADADLLKRMRRRVDLSRIVDNIQRIRATSARLDCPPPNFRFSCGLYDQNSLFVEDLARFAVSLDIKGVGFWNLTSWGFERFPYENTDVQPADRAYPLADLSSEELRPRLEAIHKGIGVLKENNIEVHINGDFITTLTARLNRSPSAEVSSGHCHQLPQGMTRDCLDPWTYFELNTNADVKPCCAHSRIGNLRKETLSQALNGPEIRRLRENLLKGTPDAECANCLLRGALRPEALRGKVRAVLEDPPENLGMFDADRISALMKTAVENLEAGRQERTWSFITRALSIDPGIERSGDYSETTIQDSLPIVLSDTRYPLTLSWLAAVFRHIGDDRSSIVLMKRYLELAPDAPDRDSVAAWVRHAEMKHHQSGWNQPTAGVSAGKTLWNQGWLWLRRKVRLRTRMRLWQKMS